MKIFKVLILSVILFSICIINTYAIPAYSDTLHLNIEIENKTENVEYIEIFISEQPNLIPPNVQYNNDGANLENSEFVTYNKDNWISVSSWFECNSSRYPTKSIAKFDISNNHAFYEINFINYHNGIKIATLDSMGNIISISQAISLDSDIFISPMKYIQYDIADNTINIQGYPFSESQKTAQSLFENDSTYFKYTGWLDLYRCYRNFFVPIFLIGNIICAFIICKRKPYFKIPMILIFDVLLPICIVKAYTYFQFIQIPYAMIPVLIAIGLIKYLINSRDKTLSQKQNLMLSFITPAMLTGFYAFVNFWYWILF